jgi:hypothetical protein
MKSPPTPPPLGPWTWTDGSIDRSISGLDARPNATSVPDGGGTYTVAACPLPTTSVVLNDLIRVCADRSSTDTGIMHAGRLN